MNFSTEELVNMIWVLGECGKNSLLATRVYQERFPGVRQPSKRTLERLMDRFNRTGSVNYEKRERTKTALTEENELNVLLSVTEDPHTSVSKISKQQDISETTVRRILSKNNMHPYHIQLHQELNNEDFLDRVNFCQWSRHKLNERRDFFDFVLFGDEATFHRNGSLNRHNFHYYATTNPHFSITHSQTRWTLNVWGGILGDFVIGPHFFEGRVTGQIYLDFLQNHLPALLEHVPLFIRQQMWFLHDGAPVHHTEMIHNFLNNQFPERWIGRGGPIRWPPRSPDLTKIDFFLWGFVKNEVYKIQPTTRDDMMNRIRNVFQSINVQMLRNVSRSFEERLDHCINLMGGHFEHLL